MFQIVQLNALYVDTCFYVLSHTIVSTFIQILLCYILFMGF